MKFSFFNNFKGESFDFAGVAREFMTDLGSRSDDELLLMVPMLKTFQVVERLSR